MKSFSFYNYIYYTVAGFSEIETFRSNQIREGLISREEAINLIYAENKPMYQSIKWYLEAIGLDFTETIKIINNIKKYYKVWLKYLFFIVHPSKFHLFKRTINALIDNGNIVDICISSKDVLEDLIINEGWNYTNLFPSGRKYKN